MSNAARGYLSTNCIYYLALLWLLHAAMICNNIHKAFAQKRLKPANRENWGEGVIAKRRIILIKTIFKISMFKTLIMHLSTK